MSTIVLDNMSMVQLVPSPIWSISNESEILNRLEKIGNIFTGEKIPTYMVVGEETSILQLRLNEEYSLLNEKIEVEKGNAFSELLSSKQAINANIEYRKNKHFNSCLAKELKALKSSNDCTSIDELITNQCIGNFYYICCNEKDFKKLLGLKGANGIPRVKKVKDKFLLDEAIEILVIKDLDKIYMLDFGELYAKVICDSKEIKDLESVRAGKIVHSLNMYVGIGSINKDNIFSCTLE
ncbi:hypothetical protein ACV3S3_11695 [Clostridium perfringens]